MGEGQATLVCEAMCDALTVTESCLG